MSWRTELEVAKATLERMERRRERLRLVVTASRENASRANALFRDNLAKLEALDKELERQRERVNGCYYAD